MQYQQKSESTTLILAILLGLFGLNGVGHIYVGKTLKGIVILIGSIALAIVFYFSILGSFFWSIGSGSYGSALGLGIGGVIAMVVVFIGLFAWQIIDSRKLCVRYNQHLADNGQPPW